MKKKDHYLLDAHIHTSGISLCSQVEPERLVEVCLQCGLGGIVLTNHYKAPYVTLTFEKWREKYVEEYEITRRFGERAGLRVFFGVEVTLNENMRNDFTVYGLTTDEILHAEPLYELDLPRFAAYVHSQNALLFHAHPFRNTKPVDPAYLDGTEINCHPLYRCSEEKRVRDFADAACLRLTCGSDYHGDTYKPHCGMWIPDTVETTEQFVEYLRQNKRPELLVAPDPLPGASVRPGAYGKF